MAKKRGSDVAIECLAEKQGIITWLWKRTADQEPRPVQLEKGRIAQSVNNTLTIRGIQSQDSGIYICQQECPQSQRQHGCGTELRVMGAWRPRQRPAGAWGLGRGAFTGHPHPNPWPQCPEGPGLT